MSGPPGGMAPLAFLRGEIIERDERRRQRLTAAIPYVGRPASARPADKWWLKAACRDMDMNLFYTVGRPNAEARDACARCPVKEPCLAQALAQDSENKYAYGYRAGMNPAARDELRASGGTWLERRHHRRLEIREKFVEMHVPTSSARSPIVTALADEYDLTARSVYRMVDDLA